jgi:hypothetical protein
VVHANRSVEAMDMDESMLASSSAAHEHHQVDSRYRLQPQQFVETGSFALVDATGDDNMHGAFSDN